MIAYFIIVSGAATIYVHTLHATHPIVVNDVSDVAVALQPLAGKFAALLFALGLLNAARSLPRVDPAGSRPHTTFARRLGSSAASITDFLRRRFFTDSIWR